MISGSLSVWTSNIDCKWRWRHSSCCCFFANGCRWTQSHRWLDGRLLDGRRVFKRNETGGDRFENKLQLVCIDYCCSILFASQIKNLTTISFPRLAVVSFPLWFQWMICHLILRSHVNLLHNQWTGMNHKNMIWFGSLDRLWIEKKIFNCQLESIYWKEVSSNGRTEFVWDSVNFRIYMKENNLTYKMKLIFTVLIARKKCKFPVFFL